MLAHSRVGAVTISGQRLPVVTLPTGSFVEQGDLLISVEGARTFKKGQYPLHPSIRPVAAAELSSFAARDPESQIAATRAVLRATMARMIDLGLPSVSEN